MQYVSTRGKGRAGFADVLIGGPAPDGGLYLPQEWPGLGETTLRNLSGKPYAEVAFAIMRPFVGGSFSDTEFKSDIDRAYAAFTHIAVSPLVQIAPNRFLLELFHGPTLAFKDIAMQLLGRLFSRALSNRGRRATVIVATSGDTGSAAIAALKGLPNLDIVVLHPKGRVSEVQRRQMTTVLDGNVHNIALEGSFDDTQRIVKALFADTDFAARTQLAAVNSINFARIVAQCVYYFTAATQLGAGHGRLVDFIVPTGNFGDIFAAEAAARMGLPTGRLVIATNKNDILVRALRTGDYSAGEAHCTLSPSMDIQVASNFERALFEASGRDAGWVEAAMRNFSQQRRLDIPASVLRRLQARYLAADASDAETVAAIARVHAETGVVIDPHTAVGIVAGDKLKDELAGPVVVLATAHPAKFNAAVKKAIGVEAPLPAHLADLMMRQERYNVLPNTLGAVKEFILERAKNG